MTSPLRKPSDPTDIIGKFLSDLEGRVRRLESAPALRIPILPADPDVTNPTNIWAFPDGRIRWRHWNVAGTAYTIREIISTAAGSATSAAALGPAAAAPVSRTLIASATWSQGYNGAGVKRTDIDTSLPWGNNGDGTGRNRSLIGFDGPTIAAALASSTITAISLTFLVQSTSLSIGADVHLGVHNYSAEPASWAGGGIPLSLAASAAVEPSSPVTIPLPLSFAELLRAGTGKGIALEASTDSLSEAGVGSGFGSGYTLPTLAVNYDK